MADGSRPGAPPQVAICIPIRNEASQLPRLFDALDRLERNPTQALQLCLLLDGCSDASGVLARDYRDRSRFDVRIEEIAPAPANAGRARHRAMLLGLAALGSGGGLLLTTDADSVPAPDWLAAMNAALRISDVVAGRVVREGTRACPLQDRIERYYDALFRLRRVLDPVPWEAATTHHYASGANMGVRAGAYAKLGGFPPLASGEDSRLVDEAARAGLRVRRDAASLVRTSDRRHGRAANGFARTLRDLDRGDADAVLVAHPSDAAWQYRMQATARLGYAAGDHGALAEAIGLDHDHLQGVARDCPNGEAFAMRVVPTPPDGMRHVSLPAAEDALAAIRDERRAA